MKEIVLICGSRNFDSPFRVANWVKDNLNPEEHLIIHGDCKDSPDHWWRLNGIKFIEIKVPANWQLHGKAAGPIRNEVMVQICHRVVAFWDGESRGTLNSINLANKYNKKVEIVR